MGWIRRETLPSTGRVMEDIKVTRKHLFLETPPDTYYVKCPYRLLLLGLVSDVVELLLSQSNVELNQQVRSSGRAGSRSGLLDFKTHFIAQGVWQGDVNVGMGEPQPQEQGSALHRTCVPCKQQCLYPVICLKRVNLSQVTEQNRPEMYNK